jgi:hypothetical protein
VIKVSQQEVCAKYLSKLDQATFALEYARFLDLAKRPISDEVYYEIARGLYESKRFEELYQMGLFQVLPSTKKIVNGVLRDEAFASSATERRQVGMDGLFRLGDAFETVVGLLEEDSFSQAVRLVVANRLYEESDMVRRLFESAKGRVDRLSMLFNLMIQKKPRWAIDGWMESANVSEFIPHEFEARFRVFAE